MVELTNLGERHELDPLCVMGRNGAPAAAVVGGGPQPSVQEGQPWLRRDAREHAGPRVFGASDVQDEAKSQSTATTKDTL